MQNYLEHMKLQNELVNFIEIILCLEFFIELRMYNSSKMFLNQARAGLRPARAWFLKIDPVRTSVCVFVCVCVRPRGC